MPSRPDPVLNTTKSGFTPSPHVAVVSAESVLRGKVARPRRCSGAEIDRPVPMDFGLSENAADGRYVLNFRQMPGKNSAILLLPEARVPEDALNLFWCRGLRKDDVPVSPVSGEPVICGRGSVPCQHPSQGEQCPESCTNPYDACGKSVHRATPFIAVLTLVLPGDPINMRRSLRKVSEHLQPILVGCASSLAIPKRSCLRTRASHSCFSQLVFSRTHLSRTHVPAKLRARIHQFAGWTFVPDW